MELAKKIDADLKTALLAGDKKLVDILRGVKSALGYAKVEARQDLDDQATMKVLQKEAKKRSDAVQIYEQAGEEDRASAERYEKEMIERYLPEMLDEDSINKLIDQVIASVPPLEQKNMGKIIGAVQKSSNGLADGSVIAKLVKERL